MTKRSEWIKEQVELIGTALPKLEAAQLLRDAMAFADAHREAGGDAVLREALDRAAYALFVAKRLIPGAVREHCAKAHQEACKVLDATPPHTPASAKE